MIIWYKHLYYKNRGDQQIELWKNKIEKKVKNKKPMFPIYCICLASNPANLLDVMNVNELLFPYYQNQKMVVLGLAGNRSEALELVAQIIEEVYQATGGVEVRSFVEEKQPSISCIKEN